MNAKEQIEAYFAGRQPQLSAAALRLAAIPSTKGEARPGAPFGPGPARCLDEALALARELGLTASNYDGYVGVVDLNDRPAQVHILCHLDVVDAGPGWTVTAPFEPKDVDGMLYGRGVADDKGPAAAVLLAMQAVKELGLPVTKGARLILGADEESGSEDIAYYYAREPYAPCAFSPDADFPVINIEKGMYRPTFSKSWKPEAALPRLASFRGGVRLNVLPADAEAVLEGLPMGALLPRAQAATRITGAQFRLAPAGEGKIRVRAHGKSAHASTPEEGLNGITALLELLGVLPLAPGECKNAVHALLKLLPHRDTRGKGLDIAMSDELSGELTVAFSLLEIGETGLTGRFDSRVPLCATRENCQARAEAAFAGLGFSCAGGMDPPHHTDAGSPFVRTLLRCYREITGQEGGCVAIGGGTYVHGIPGGVAFGPVQPGFQTNLHGPDERIPAADLLTAAKIYALAIAELCA